MVEGIMYGLFFGFFLSLFNFDKMLIEVFQPFVEVTLTTSHYYVAYALIGVITGLITSF